jgi:putative membrane protein
MGSTRGRASAAFSSEERRAVEKAVGEAEEKTAAEIVPVVAASSARHRRGDDIAGLWLAFLAIVLLAVFSPEHQIDGIEAVVAFVIAVALGAFVAEKVPALKRLFVPHADLHAAAADGALRAFRTFGVGHTRDRTGLLIYVSLFERSAVIVGDGALSAALAKEDYAAIRDVLTGGLRRGRVPEALLSAIRKAGEILEKKLPRDPKDRPEITNALRLLD